MFGENPSESVRLPSPWDTPHQGVSRQGTPLNAPKRSPPPAAAGPAVVDLELGLLSSLVLFDPLTEDASPVEDEDERLDDVGGRGSNLGGFGGKGLAAEEDRHGQVEYKLKLTDVSPDRFNRLTTQMKWRLLEGGGEALYEIGVLDDGTLVGLSRGDLSASLRTLERMATELGATVLVVREVRLATLPCGRLNADDLLGSRRKWETFQRGLKALALAGGGKEKEREKEEVRESEREGPFKGPGKRRFERNKRWEEIARSTTTTTVAACVLPNEGLAGSSPRGGPTPAVDDGRSRTTALLVREDDLDGLFNLDLSLTTTSFDLGPGPPPPSALIAAVADAAVDPGSADKPTSTSDRPTSSVEDDLGGRRAEPNGLAHSSGSSGGTDKEEVNDAEEDEKEEDGTERICVEVLVVRKEMDRFLDLDQVGRW